MVGREDEEVARAKRVEQIGQPPVECLSTTLRPSAAPRSIVTPLRIIAAVSANVSALDSPWKYTAMRNAASW